MKRRTKTAIALATTPLALAGVAGAVFAARAAATRRKGILLEGDVPVPEPSLGLAAAVALDTLINMPMTALSSIGSAEQYGRASDELDQAVKFYAEAGWLDDPGLRHPAPPQAPDGEVDDEVFRYASRWEPVDGEPGGDRWRCFAANGVVPVRLLRHPGGPRPWLIAVHGQGMGRPRDVRMLRVRKVHEELGINVALPALPLHGPRSAGFAPEQQFVSNVFLLNNVLGLTQAVWDLRQLLLWLRTEQEAPAVGVLGLSLGSYVSAILSTYESDLACVIGVVPTSDLAASLRAAVPLLPSRRRMHAALHDERSTMIHHVVSPLARPCLVPHERRFLIAGQGDQIAPPAGAAELWRHWDQPSIDWRPRGHLTTGSSAAHDERLSAILVATGLATERGGT